jgi:hypothetical protein
MSFGSAFFCFGGPRLSSAERKLEKLHVPPHTFSFIIIRARSHAAERNTPSTLSGLKNNTPSSRNALQFSRKTSPAT